ncbi:VanZ family protein [Streptomyces sp. NPDC052301]|uniref:VanZ family protein n=1 Tax=Streptomyces sp. NPDC052301 TaxID=3365687 RepID=UPI0037D366D5
MARTAPHLPAILRTPRKRERTSKVGTTRGLPAWLRARRRSEPAERAGGARGPRGFRRRNRAGEAGDGRGLSASPRATGKRERGQGRDARRLSGGLFAFRRREPDAADRPRHALPLPVRLLAMLVAFACMVAFAVVLARLTLRPSPASVTLTHSNLHPGRSLKDYLEHAQVRDAIRQIGGNLLLGVPFGILVPVLAPRARGMFRVAALTALVMLTVELVQGALITGRAFDIDDVILNTAGALLGWLLLGRRLGRAVHARVRPSSAD